MGGPPIACAQAKPLTASPAWAHMFERRVVPTPDHRTSGPPQQAPDPPLPTDLACSPRQCRPYPHFWNVSPARSAPTTVVRRKQPAPTVAASRP
jgi:hypothetical protein